MKKTILSFLTLLLSLSICLSQDIISKINGEKILVEIIEVKDSVITYEKFDYINSPLISIPKSELLSVRYKNGTKVTYNEPLKTDSTLIANEAS